MDNEFNGVFYFTNPTKEDFTALWNNKEYVFPKESTCPIIIREETLEGIQEIRKNWAYALAVREFYKGSFGEYKKMMKMGGGLPPLYDEKILEPMIESCLTPLPLKKSQIKEVKKRQAKFKGSKAVSDKDNLSYSFKDDEPTALGQMPDKI